MERSIIGKRLRAHREAHPKVTLERLAKETRSLSKSRISNYEQGIRTLKAKEAQILSEAFRRLGKPINAAELLGLSEHATGVGASREKDMILQKYDLLTPEDRAHFRALVDALAAKRPLTKKHHR